MGFRTNPGNQTLRDGASYQLRCPKSFGMCQTQILGALHWAKIHRLNQSVKSACVESLKLRDSRLRAFDECTIQILHASLIKLVLGRLDEEAPWYFLSRSNASIQYKLMLLAHSNLN